jgi:predicted nuclease of predicted toxin-antitoxin system
VDAQLSPALGRWLGEQGFPATAVREIGLRESDDGSIWNFAVSGGWTVITKDEDLAVRCIGDPAAVWLRLGNCTNRFLFAWIKPFLPEIERRLNAGEKLIEIRDPVKQVP